MRRVVVRFNFSYTLIGKPRNPLLHIASIVKKDFFSNVLLRSKCQLYLVEFLSISSAIAHQPAYR